MNYLQDNFFQDDGRADFNISGDSPPKHIAAALFGADDGADDFFKSSPSVSATGPPPSKQ